MRTSGLAVLISANFLPHIAISNNSPPGIELIQDPAWGDKSWNIDRKALQGLSASVSSLCSRQVPRRLMLLTLYPVTPIGLT